MPRLRDRLDAATPRPWAGWSEDECGYMSGIHAPDAGITRYDVATTCLAADTDAIVAVMNAADDFVALYEAAGRLLDSLGYEWACGDRNCTDPACATLAVLDRLRATVEGDR